MPSTSMASFQYETFLMNMVFQQLHIIWLQDKNQLLNIFGFLVAQQFLRDMKSRLKEKDTKQI